ncbi:hypothetical protein PVL29_021934 [Vitis rotundifolia]|uniref:Uncharacterized protein n=1 Tax=Vitis rotundifolia TaxID=103349 RepID=A0AA39D9B5_VITRO|nr:hypothetical protein PVL29_021934 [Vitis rotundifolia]
MEDLDSGHLRCEGYGCKKICQRVAQELSHDEPILHEQGSLQLAPHHSKALKIQKQDPTNSRFFRLNRRAGGAHNQECDSNRNQWPLNYVGNNIKIHKGVVVYLLPKTAHQTTRQYSHLAHTTRQYSHLAHTTR